MKNVWLVLALAAPLACSTQRAPGQYAYNPHLLPRAAPSAAERPVLLARKTTLLVRPESRAAFLTAVEELATLARLEEGYLTYRCQEDPNARNTFFVKGEWTTKAALDAHRQQPYVAHYFKQLPAWLAAPATTTTYHVSKRSPATGQPAAH